MYCDENGSFGVPAFGVTFGKGNQSYFKDIKLSTGQFGVTEAGLNATFQIAAKGSETIRQTTLYGQDIYKVYANNAYECTVEMMGDMQIFPPMLFQLNNIPMWKGAYMIKKVTHVITPGDATTTIGEYCFQSVKSTLSALTISNTVTTIQHEAFMETELLTTLTIPASVTQIDFWAFTRCNGLNEVIFKGTTPPTFTNQHDGVFHDYCPPVIYVPDEALSAYRAIDGSVWTNQSWSTDIIQPISNRT